jgi:hypothetical protein
MRKSKTIWHLFVAGGVLNVAVQLSGQMLCTCGVALPWQVWVGRGVLRRGQTWKGSYQNRNETSH